MSECECPIVFAAEALGQERTVVFAGVPLLLRLGGDSDLCAVYGDVDVLLAHAGQFCDHGSQYRTGIFYHNEEQKKLAEASKGALQKTKPFKGDIVTEVTKAPEFYAAETYHQDFYKKNPARYKIYRSGCGRDARLQALWGRAGD